MQSSEHWVKLGAGLAVSVAAVVYGLFQSQASGTGNQGYDLSVDETTGELVRCPKRKLLQILEDLQMEYTPYYTHYFHLLGALEQEYRGKPILQQKLRDKICAKLEDKTKEIQAAVVEKYMVEGDSAELAAWISFYCQQDPLVSRLVNLFQVNEDKLFLRRPPEKPDFELQFPAKLSKRVYVLVVKKIFATMRHYMYKEIRAILRARGSQTALSGSAVSGTSTNYLTKNELRGVLE